MHRSYAVRSGDGRWDAASTDGVQMVAFYSAVVRGNTCPGAARMLVALAYALPQAMLLNAVGVGWWTASLANCYALVTIGISQTYGVTVEAPAD